jgi:hypothetical protein
LNGADEMPAGELAELRKALEATELRGSDPSAQSGAPLKVESLENTLKIITFQEGDIEFWKRIPKLPAYNTVEEYNQLVSYGSDRGGFVNEGELPEEEDSIYARKAQLVKFIGTTKSVTHPMQLVNTMIGDVVAREVKNGTLWVLRKVDKALTFANSDIIPQEFNGLYKQHFDGFGGTLDQYGASNVIVDLKGKALSEAVVEDAALGVIENFGFGDFLMAPPAVLSNFVKRFHGNKFIQPNTPAITAGVMGQRVKTFASQFGDIELGYDKFMKASPPRLAASAATHPKAPSAVIPDISTSLAANPTDTSGQFLTAWAGDYYYAVAATNRYGESVLTALSQSKLTVAAAGSALLKFADGGGIYPATGYVVYRSLKSPASLIGVTPLYPIFSVSVAQLAAGYDGGSVGIVCDRNRSISGTESAFLIQNNTEVYSFKQLAPLMKMDLAVLGPAIRFMVLLYGTPQLYAPLKMIKFTNVGNDLT